MSHIYAVSRTVETKGGNAWGQTFGLQKSLKGPQSATPLFLFIYKNFGIIFFAERVLRKAINVKLPKVIKQTSSAIVIRFAYSFHNFDGIVNGRD